MTDHVLYRVFDAEDALLYVGITLSPVARLRKHRRKNWWSEVATIRIETCSSREELLRRERCAIEHEMPRYNVAFNGMPRQKTYALEQACEIICGDASLKSMRWLMRQIKSGRASSRRRAGELRMADANIEDLIDKCSNRSGLSDWAAAS